MMLKDIYVGGLAILALTGAVMLFAAPQTHADREKDLTKEISPRSRIHHYRASRPKPVRNSNSNFLISLANPQIAQDFHIPANQQRDIAKIVRRWQKADEERWVASWFSNGAKPVPMNFTFHNIGMQKSAEAEIRFYLQTVNQYKNVSETLMSKKMMPPRLLRPIPCARPLTLPQLAQ